MADAIGRRSHTRKDAWGRTSEVIPPTGPGVTYAYDTEDQLLSATRGGVTTALTYDIAGRKTAMSDPDMGAWSYTYDAFSNLVSQTDARTCVTNLAYRCIGRSRS